jgi:hypothetical protein
MQIINRFNTYKKRSLSIVAGTMLGIGLILSPAASAITIGGPSDCDSNAIISCGAHSTGALKDAYNSSAYVRKVYAYFGISSADIANLASTDVAGSVTSGGAVLVNGQTVANNAVTGGRQNIAGSTQVNFQGITFFKRPPSVSFQQSSLPAFVSMKNGVFQFAVIASCGNAVMAHPTSAPQKAAVAPARAVSTPPKPQQPKPATQAAQAASAAAPTQEQAQLQAQQQEVEVNIHNSNTQNVQEAAPQTTPETAPTETVAAAGAQPATEQASKLVDTGPGGTIGVFLAATSLGIVGYRRFILRRLMS